MEKKEFERKFKFYRTIRDVDYIKALYKRASEKQREEIMEYEMKELEFHRQRDKDLGLEEVSSMTDIQMKLVDDLKKIDKILS